MQTRTRVFIAFVTTIILGACLSFWWIASRHPSRIILPDGRKMPVLKVSFDTDHTYVVGDNWFYRSLPEKVKSWLGIPPAYTMELDHTSTASLALWLRAPVDEYTLPSYFLFTGDDGTELLAAPFRSGDDSGILVLQFQSFPRRAGVIEITPLFTQEGKTPLRGRPFKVMNTLKPPPPPTWESVSLPATVAGAEPSFSLLDLAATKIDLAQNEPLSFYFDYKVGEGTPQWDAAPVRISDESGNVVERFSYSIMGNRRLVAAPGLNPADVWRMEIEYSPSSSYAGPNVTVLRDIPVPRPGEQIELNREFTAGGGECRLKGVGNGAYRFGDKDIKLEGCLLVFEFPEGAVTHIIKVEDDQGRKLPQVGGSSGRRQYAAYRVEPGAKSLEATIVVALKHRAEFFVQPRVIRTMPE